MFTHVFMMEISKITTMLMSKVENKSQQSIPIWIFEYLPGK